MEKKTEKQSTWHETSSISSSHTLPIIARTYKQFTILKASKLNSFFLFSLEHCSTRTKLIINLNILLIDNNLAFNFLPIFFSSILSLRFVRLFFQHWIIFIYNVMSNVRLPTSGIKWKTKEKKKFQIKSQEKYQH